MSEVGQQVEDLSDDSDLKFWQDVSSSCLNEIWDNADDDRYRELLSK
jgi:hypothetical protein